MRPMTPPSATIGIPIVPNATGAVFATRQRPAAYRGRNPNPTRVAPAIATGAPKPAAPSMKAPKQKAIMSACSLPVGRHAGQRGADDLKLAALDGEVVEEKGRKDDVEDGKDPECGTLQAREGGEPGGHAPDADREDDGRGER